MGIERHRLQREKNAGAYMEPAADGNWVTFADHAAELARVEGERDKLRREVSMLSREVSRESSLRRKIETLLNEHAEYIRENRMLDDQARATDAAGVVKGVE